MARRRKPDNFKTISFFISAIIAISVILAISNWWNFFITLFAVTGAGAIVFLLMVLYFASKSRKKHEAINSKLTESEIPQSTLDKLSSETAYFLSEALAAEISGDFLKTRMLFMQCMETMRNKRDTQEYNDIFKVYADFVRRDPVFQRFAEVLIKGIELNPGIMQSQITSKLPAAESWGVLQYYNRQITKDDIYYALYFMDEFKMIIRKKKGRSYELYPLGSSILKQIEGEIK